MNAVSCTADIQGLCTINHSHCSRDCHRHCLQCILHLHKLKIHARDLPSAAPAYKIPSPLAHLVTGIGSDEHAGAASKHGAGHAEGEGGGTGAPIRLIAHQAVGAAQGACEGI
jgi:hypothetical protein